MGFCASADVTSTESQMKFICRPGPYITAKQWWRQDGEALGQNRPVGKGEDCSEGEKAEHGSYEVVKVINV